MIPDLIITILTGEQRRILQIIAETAVIGGNEEEVAAYLITRGIDDMMRSGVLKLGGAA